MKTELELLKLFFSQGFRFLKVDFVRSLTLGGTTIERSVSVRLFDILVHSAVSVVNAGATLLGHLGFSDVGPFAIAIRPSITVAPVTAPVPSALDLRPPGSELPGVPSSQSDA